VGIEAVLIVWIIGASRAMDIEREIEIIKERNARVEADKAWETSFTRRAFIAMATYLIASLWLVMIGETSIWLKAAVPTGGYILSTLSLSFIKKWWFNNIWRKQKYVKFQ
jgi:hypothetical protein